jgi:hypothetical protein
MSSSSSSSSRQSTMRPPRAVNQYTFRTSRNALRGAADRAHGGHGSRRAAPEAGRAGTRRGVPVHVLGPRSCDVAATTRRPRPTSLAAASMAIGSSSAIRPPQAPRAATPHLPRIRADARASCLPWPSDCEIAVRRQRGGSRRPPTTPPWRARDWVRCGRGCPMTPSASARVRRRPGCRWWRPCNASRDVVLIAGRSSHGSYVSRPLTTVSYRQRSPRPVSTTDLLVPAGEP